MMHIIYYFAEPIHIKENFVGKMDAPFLAHAQGLRVGVVKNKKSVIEIT